MVSRRTLLRTALVGGGALGGGLTAGLLSLQPRRHSVPGRRLGQRLQPGKRVIVVGGGLAGLSAALELAERGAAVTLLEAGPQLGGKLSGWPYNGRGELAGEHFAMEHGFHGFFAQYYNLNDALSRLGCDALLRPVSRYPIAYADGGEENFSGERRLFPFNLLALYAQSDRLRLKRVLEAGPRMEALLRYHPTRTYEALDGVSFAEFARELDPELASGMLLPFAKTTLNDPAHTSAAHALRFMHLYFLGSPEGLSYRTTVEDCMRAVIDPWASHLRARGVTVRTSAQVGSLLVREGRVAGVVLGNRVPERRVVAQLPLELGDAPAHIGADERGSPVFAHRLGDEVWALRGACTHQGCPVRGVATGFVCPCHGGAFNLRGEVTSGPPQRPLERLLVEGNDVVSTGVGELAETLEADDVIVACDVRGARALAAASDLPGPIGARLAQLAEAAPYLVMRAWLDRRARADRCEFYTTSGFSLLDAIALYDRLQRPYQAWAERTGQGVVELHAYGIPAHLDRGENANRETLLAELRVALPELREARVLDVITMQQSNFSGFPPGSHAARPGTNSGVEGLHLAGDWVRTELPVALMEAAVTTGRVAANAVLERHGAETCPIVTVAEHGVLG